MIQRILIIFIALVVASCNTVEKKKDKSIISVSILPQKYFVEKIAGELFNVNVMIPPGASPATYEPSPAQITSLSETDIYMKIGHTVFELSWMEKLASANDAMKLVDLSAGIDLIAEEHHHGSHVHSSVDPHIWMSPANVKIMASGIKAVLTEQYPEHEDLFAENLGQFLEELDSLDTHIRSSLSQLESRNFMIYHPALSYFARDYDLHQHPMELEGKSPSPSYMKELVDEAREEEISVIFLQMQFDQHNAETIAKEIGAEIVQINPLDPDWHQQMLIITEKLAAKL